MLNEQFLNAVSGGKPFIELIGQFLSAMIPTKWGAFGGSIGRYEAHDDMGHIGHVEQAKVTYQPPVLQSWGFENTQQHITVLNSDDMRDLKGCRIYAAEKHTLPPALVSAVEKSSLHPIHSGGNVHGLYGIAIPDSVKGTEITFKGEGKTDAKLTISKTTDKQSPLARFTTGGNTFGVNLSAGLSFTDAKVETVDRMANDSYCQWKIMMDQIQRNNEMMQQQQLQQQLSQQNPWSTQYYY